MNKPIYVKAAVSKCFGVLLAAALLVDSADVYAQVGEDSAAGTPEKPDAAAEPDIAAGPDTDAKPDTGRPQQSADEANGPPDEAESTDATEAEPGQEAPQLSPPALTKRNDPPLPEGALAPGTQASVDLAITIDANGVVTEVVVLAEALEAAADPEALKQLAVDTARGFVFSPARRGDEPIAARITYRYVFEAPVEAPTEGALRLTLLDADGAPMPNAPVEVRGQSSKTPLTTDANGKLEAMLPPGQYTVAFVDNQGTERFYEEEVVAGEATEVTYRTPKAEDAAEDSAEFGATAVALAPPREVTRRTLQQRELIRIAGTRGDPVRAIEVLPGIGRPPFGTGQVLIRGASPNDSEIFFEGAPIPLLYHFGGFVSIFPAFTIESIDYIPGNFGVRYGRKIGGIIEVNGADRTAEEIGGFVDVSVIDASLGFEVPTSDKFTLAASARRSYIDTVFDTIVPDSAFDVVAAPVYWDYQTSGTWRPNKRDKVVFSAYGSSDRLRLLLSDASDQDPTIRGSLGAETQFHRFETRWSRKVSSKLDQRLMLSVGPTFLTFDLGPELNFDLDIMQVYGRADWAYRFSKKWAINTGLDVNAGGFRVDATLPPNDQGEGNPGGPLASQDILSRTASGGIFEPAVFLEGIYTPDEQWAFVLGGRADYFNQINEFAFDPRGVIRYALFPHLRFKAGVGLFSQNPQPQEAEAGVDGNPNLKPTRAVHVSGGVEKDLFGELTIGVEGFYKYIFDRVVGTEDNLAPFFTNDGLGRIYGAEFELRLLPGSSRYYALMSYTLSRSERRDRGGPWRLFDFDQTHIMNVAGGYRFKRDVEIGARFQLVSGNPATPITGSIYDVNNDVFTPVFGGINSIRNPLFNRFDIRIAKTWYVDQQIIMLYFDVQNATNAQNQEGIAYNFDYTESAPVNGLPILPSVGLRVQF